MPFEKVPTRSSARSVSPTVSRALVDLVLPARARQRRELAVQGQHLARGEPALVAEQLGQVADPPPRPQVADGLAEQPRLRPTTARAGRAAASRPSSCPRRSDPGSRRPRRAARSSRARRGRPSCRTAWSARPSGWRVSRRPPHPERPPLLSQLLQPRAQAIRRAYLRPFAMSGPRPASGCRRRRRRCRS